MRCQLACHGFRWWKVVGDWTLTKRVCLKNPAIWWNSWSLDPGSPCLKHAIIMMVTVLWEGKAWRTRCFLSVQVTCNWKLHVFCISMSSILMHLSNKRKPGWLGYIGDHTTQLYIIGIIISHYKDPYKTTRTMERRGFFSCLTSTPGLFQDMQSVVITPNTISSLAFLSQWCFFCLNKNVRECHG